MRPRTRSLAFLALWLVAGAACDDPAARPRGATRPADLIPTPELLPYEPPRGGVVSLEYVDSAGVMLARNAGPGAWGADLLTVEEELRVDPFAGDAESGPRRITAVWIGPEGNLFVSLGERGLRVFGPRGRPLLRVAASPTGRVPFESILTSWVRGDSLFVYDPQLRRLSLLSTAGAHIASWDDPRRAYGLVVPAAPGPDGWIAEIRPPIVRPAVRAGEPFERPPRRLHRFTPGSDTVGPAIFEIPRAIRYGAPAREAGLDPALFEAQPHWEFDAAGRLFITSTRDYGIEIHDPSGRLARRVTRGHRPAPIPAGTIDEARRLVVQYFDTVSFPVPQLRHAWLETLDNGARLPVPATMPPLGRLHVATDGAFWVERLDDVPPARYQFEWFLGSADERPSRWDLFAADARFLGTVELPRGFAPLRVLGDRVAGVLRRPDRADQLVVFRVRAPSARPVAEHPVPRYLERTDADHRGDPITLIHLRPLLSFLALLGVSLPLGSPVRTGERADQFPNPGYNGRFTFTRIQYSGGGFRRGGSSWAHDWPDGDINMQSILDEVTSLAVNLGESNVFRLDDPAIFRNPIIYISEPGYWSMSEAEVAGLRNYLLKGGFVIFDDFEERQWYNFEEQLMRALPEYELIELAFTHAIFDSFFHMQNVDVPHPLVAGITPHYYGVFEDNDPGKRMMVMVNFNNDLAEYWEFSGRGYFPMDLTNDAWRLGVNYIIYGLTH